MAADSENLEPENSSIEFKILFQDEHLIAIEKPHGFHVHQPEMARRRVSPDIVCLPILRRQIEQYLYPVHRIDVGTEGVLIFALTKEAAANFCYQFQTRVPKKTYFAIVRGFAPDEGVIDIPLELDSTHIPVAACTRFKTHQRVELPVPVGKRHKSARYSLVEAFPETGRFHQVRRHLARLAHPLAGDCVHGDSHHNRFFRTELAAPGLWLKAMALEVEHPKNGRQMKFHSDWSPRWDHVFQQLGFVRPMMFPVNGFS